jgi:hypothetical protein
MRILSEWYILDSRCSAVVYSNSYNSRFIITLDVRKDCFRVNSLYQQTPGMITFDLVGNSVVLQKLLTTGCEIVESEYFGDFGFHSHKAH